MAIAKVIISNRQKDVKIPTGIRMLMRRCCEATLRTEGFTEPGEISISFVSNEEIKSINATKQEALNKWIIAYNAYIMLPKKMGDFLSFSQKFKLEKLMLRFLMV